VLTAYAAIFSRWEKSNTKKIKIRCCLRELSNISAKTSLYENLIVGLIKNE